MTDTATERSDLWQVRRMRFDSMFSAENREMRKEECDIYRGSARKPKQRFDSR